jgi:two-component system, OmpR family, response regulator
MPVRVLITDSDRSLLNTYGEFLSRAGFEVATACDGLECIRTLRAWEPDVVVLELNIPWGGGVGVLDLMRHSAELPHVPVVVLTSHWNESNADDALAYCLAESFDFKPLAPEQLARIVRRQIDNMRAPADAPHRLQGRRISPNDAASVLCD